MSDTLYSLGLKVSDIDAALARVHIRDAKGNRDRFVLLPEAKLTALRQFRQLHRHPELLFPNRYGRSEGGASRPHTTRSAVCKSDPICHATGNVSSGLFPDSEIPLSSPPFPRDTTTSAAYPPVMCS